MHGIVRSIGNAMNAQRFVHNQYEMQTKIVARRKHGEQVICVPSIGERICIIT